MKYLEITLLIVLLAAMTSQSQTITQKRVTLSASGGVVSDGVHTNVAVVAQSSCSESSNGTYHNSGGFLGWADSLITAVVDEETGLPSDYSVSSNYPNPFNPVTTIEYSLPERNHVMIEVFNVLGQRVRGLVDKEESVGSHTITWDGNDSSGKSVATGVYLYRFQAGEHVQTKKMLLLK